MSAGTVKAVKSLGATASCMTLLLLSACGGGSGVKTYNVKTVPGAGGGISPSSATVDAGGATRFTVTPQSGYVIGGVTGCGGTLSGNTYTTGKINANCTVAANFAATWTWVGGSDKADASGVYGTQGVAAASNIPGAHFTSATWTDSSGNLWLFGGTGRDASGAAGDLNDLWSYSAASGKWTWVGGSNVIDQAGVYGTQDLAAASNVPGARFASAAWTDAGGELWLFGGWGYDSAGTQGGLNDLWKYSPSSGEWTWVGGSNAVNQTGVYGTRGVATASNTPGARNSAATWVDSSGDLWLFGGRTDQAQSTSGYWNDLWKYSPATGEWTWVGGSDIEDQQGVYGTKGVAAASNVPGARSNATVWTDANGNVWLFGGWGHDSAGNVGDLNDLWEYSPGSGQWTWVGGSDIENQLGNYGAQGVAAASNIPSARNAAVTWVDTHGNVWLFGGWGIDSTGGSGFLDDLWKYSPASGEWSWVGGPTVANQWGVYGTQGISATSNIPGARCCEAAWTDSNGDLWLFGGAGYDSAGTQDALNDLWKYPTQ